MDLNDTIAISASGLKAQTGRMNVIAQNIANADSTADKPGAEPYRRKIPTFVRRFDKFLQAYVVDLGRVRKDQSALKTKFDPGHPAADAKGEVKLPNVNSLIETVDMQEAQRSYQAGLNLITATRRMISSTLGILRA